MPTDYMSPNFGQPKKDWAAVFVGYHREAIQSTGSSRLVCPQGHILRSVVGGVGPGDLCVVCHRDDPNRYEPPPLPKPDPVARALEGYRREKAVAGVTAAIARELERREKRRLAAEEERRAAAGLEWRRLKWREKKARNRARRRARRQE